MRTRFRAATAAAIAALAVLAPTLTTPDVAVAARSSFQSKLLNGTGAMRADHDGRFGLVSVATANSLRTLTYNQTVADVNEVAAKADIIGFQEGQKSHTAKAYRTLTSRGWDVTQGVDDDGRSELAVAWRTDKFALVSDKLVWMHEGNPSDKGLKESYPARYVQKVVLTHLVSGQKLTVFNTHVNHHTERYKDTPKAPGLPYANLNAKHARVHFTKISRMIANDDSRWRVATGDFNWGYVADLKKRHPDFVHGKMDPVTVSSYKSLGVRDTKPTHPESGRYIDYVFLARNTDAGFRAHRTVDTNSDHHAVVAEIALN